MNKLCKTLVETYNTNHIDSSPELYQVAWYSVCKKHKLKRNGRVVLKQLVNNHYEKNKPIVKYMSGPRSLSLHYSKKYNMIIYVFGEEHGMKYDCKGMKGETKIHNFLKKLSLTTDVFIDFYLEIPQFIGKGKYINRYTLGKHQYISKIQSVLLNCIETISRTDKKCKLIRAHFGDIRKREEYRNLTNPLNELKYVLRYEPNDLNIKRHRDVLRKMAGTRSDFVKWFRKEILKMDLIKKETMKSFLSKEIIKNSFDDIDYSLDRDWEHINKSAKMLLKKKKYTTSDTYNLLLRITPVNSVIVDIYTLSRVFRTFDIKRAYAGKKLEKVTIDQLGSPHNVIMYFGDLHSQSYRRFLDKVGFKLLATAGKEAGKCDKSNTGWESNIWKSRRCLDMTRFPQPFFGGRFNKEGDWQP